ncbi:MAG: response regulator, partial [Polyangiaceae bacterium]|nr:response regulator [Polyangiaceae bacterium]
HLVLGTTRDAGHADLAPGDYIELVVADTGEGMSPEVQARAFEPFFSTKSPGQGSGLGLSNVYGAVTQNGGAISLTSAPAMGSRFRILWPCAEEQVEPSEEEPVSSKVGKSERILVVEDEELVRELCVQILKEAGYRVEGEGQPTAALERFRGTEAEFDLLLTDVVMPEMNGRELAERVLKRFPHLPIIFMSGYTRDTINDRGELGPNFRFLAKPFRRQGLLTEVHLALSAAKRSATMR